MENKNKGYKKRKVLYVARGICIFLFFITFSFASMIYGVTSSMYKDLNVSEDAVDLENSVYKKTNYNFLLVGADESGSRTDTMLVGSYNTKGNILSIISIPRDTHIVMPEERRNILTEAGYYVPSSGEMKMTEISHYANEYGLSFLQAQLEELLGIDIDFYVKINTEAFRYIIDSMGGVEFYVPQRMYYMDPVQNLSIDLYEGLQILDGKGAEGLVRYRKADLNNPISEGYARGDLDRIQVQQDFLSACLEQFLTLGNIDKTIPVLLKAVSSYIETNFNIGEIYKFLPMVSGFDINNLNMYTLPNEESYINGKSYVLPIEEELKELVSKAFYNM
ncbi:MAG: LCP family protein [Lachnospirales bacterium]